MPGAKNKETRKASAGHAEDQGTRLSRHRRHLKATALAAFYVATLWSVCVSVGEPGAVLPFDDASDRSVRDGAPWDMPSASHTPEQIRSPQRPAAVVSNRIADVRVHWERTANELKAIDLPYFVYNESDFSALLEPHQRQNRMVKRYDRDVQYDKDVLRYLKAHPLRTHDAAKAKYFVLPFSPGEIVTWRQKSRSESEFARVFESVVAHPIFRRNDNGNNHILVSTVLVTFNSYDAGKVRLLAKWYKKLYNVTVAMSFDVKAMIHEYRKPNNIFTGSDFEYIARASKQIVRSSFSSGLGVSTALFPMTLSSVQKFDDSHVHIFYQTRTQESVSNSSRYRWAPITRTNLANRTYPMHPPSHHTSNGTVTEAPRLINSIGYGISDPNEWMKKFHSSQFCLNIRGDTPHSHALMRSVRAGCIPVVIADTLPLYAPTLKSTLRMSDYSVIIAEAEFLRDPQAALERLHELPRSYIEEKLVNLSFAQRVMFGDHPESVFVEAFLREASNAMKS